MKRWKWINFVSKKKSLSSEIVILESFESHTAWLTTHFKVNTTLHVKRYFLVALSADKITVILRNALYHKIYQRATFFSISFPPYSQLLQYRALFTIVREKRLSISTKSKGRFGNCHRQDPRSRYNRRQSQQAHAECQVSSNCAPSTMTTGNDMGVRLRPR